MTGAVHPPRTPITGDVKCLGCGAWNIPENKICGRCGANLPLVFDSEGHVVRLEENSQRSTDLRTRVQVKIPSTGRVRWILRGTVILFALLVLWLFRHR